MKILYVNDDPVEWRLREALEAAHIEAQIVIAKREHEAWLFLPRADEFDLVLMDYDMGRGESNSTVATGLVQKFIEVGFGKGGKPMVANSRSGRSNDRLLEAGCSHECTPEDFEYFFANELKL